MATLSPQDKTELLVSLKQLHPKVVVRLGEMIEKGSDSIALRAITQLHNLLLPEPKVNTAEVARQAAIGAGAGAGAGLAALAGKAHARLVPLPSVTDATYSTVHTPTKGGKSE